MGLRSLLWDCARYRMLMLAENNHVVSMTTDEGHEMRLRVVLTAQWLRCSGAPRPPAAPALVGMEPRVC